MKVAQDFMVEVPALKIDEMATRARKILRDDVYREVYVHDAKGHLVGYLDITGVLNVTSTKSNVTIEGFTKETLSVKAGQTLEEVIRTIRSNATDSVPVVDDQNVLLGGVLLSDLFPVFITRHRLQGRVRDHMSVKVVKCSPDDPVQKVYNLVIDSGFSAFPVEKKRKLVGIISRRDLLKDGRWRTSIEGGTAGSPVESVMTTPVISTVPEEDLQKAAETLVKHDISRLPVLDEGVLVGIIDRHDVLKFLK